MTMIAGAATLCRARSPASDPSVLSTLGSLGEDLERQQVKAPAIIVIGEVVRVAHPEAFAAATAPIGG
jgi:uroporphyrin-III C-methyltransferase/precorrin-2 dehydrogenase/sirohydrochlorin ferrochelatase